MKVHNKSFCNAGGVAKVLSVCGYGAIVEWFWAGGFLFSRNYSQ